MFNNGLIVLHWEVAYTLLPVCLQYFSTAGRPNKIDEDGEVDKAFQRNFDTSRKIWGFKINRALLVPQIDIERINMA